MPFRLSDAARNAAGDGLVDLLDSGGTATIQIRTGTQPADPNDSATGTLLATLTFSATAFGAFVSGTGTANAITSDTSVETGTAGYARLLTGGGATHSDMDIGEGSGTLNFDDVDFIAGGTAAITSMTMTKLQE